MLWGRSNYAQNAAEHSFALVESVALHSMLVFHVVQVRTEDGLPKCA